MELLVFPSSICRSLGFRNSSHCQGSLSLLQQSDRSPPLSVPGISSVSAEGRGCGWYWHCGSLRFCLCVSPLQSTTCKISIIQQRFPCPPHPDARNIHTPLQLKVGTWNTERTAGMVEAAPEMRPWSSGSREPAATEKCGSHAGLRLQRPRGTGQRQQRNPRLGAVRASQYPWLWPLGPQQQYPQALQPLGAEAPTTPASLVQHQRQQAPGNPRGTCGCGERARDTTSEAELARVQAADSQR